MNADQQYLTILDSLYYSDNVVQGRNGAVTSHFGTQMRFNDVGNVFPLLLSKKVHFRSVAVELLWFISGVTNIKYLHDHNVTIWDEWADENGNLGPVYGKQWRHWKTPFGFTIDQFKEVIGSLIKDPHGRRHIVSAWNPSDIEDMALPPCHCLFQFNVGADGRLNLQLYQRSADWFLGVPFNIASYALLLILVAREIGREPGDFIHSFGDYHLYHNTFNATKEQLYRMGSEALKAKSYPKIQITAPPEKSIFDLTIDDIKLINYDPLGTIKAPVSK